MKKLLVMAAVLLLLSSPLIVLSILNHGNPLMNKWITHDVKNHLTEMAYEKSDIQKEQYVIPKMVINHDFYQTHYGVIFKDEPQLTYYYGKKKWFGEVVQFCEKDNASTYDLTAKTTEHSEESCEYMLENR
ncbi:DUF3139 domain-containing protein [Bacillus sp. ISL-47]|uniref:DUF3139 domain-containing protein n=1 Tax=Bacillus sp. ISL-47 TaxID=2819130 RepID=UPI001BE80B2D|nr:DUF3139 domain-containing protein [Bacillus sp. ISL-47]MBT2690210.1 DUF3139 domain-containing protein [Bacillus sp. ISL-47]MBT2710341.1 DUF3139 domain-containing protein [Pseudomonas sp. ISL-84]